MSQADNPHTIIASALPPSLASLVRRYWDECDAFSESPIEPDKEVKRDTYGRAEQAISEPMRQTLSQINGVSVRTAEDACAVFDFLVDDGVDLADYNPLGSNVSLYTIAVTSAVDGLRRYLANLPEVPVPSETLRP